VTHDRRYADGNGSGRCRGGSDILGTAMNDGRDWSEVKVIKETGCRGRAHSATVAPEAAKRAQGDAVEPITVPGGRTVNGFYASYARPHLMEKGG
jgi:hypothetical protein